MYFIWSWQRQNQPFVGEKIRNITFIVVASHWILRNVSQPFFMKHLTTATEMMLCKVRVLYWPINPFQAAGLILYPQKKLENQRFSDAFRGYRKRSVVWNGLKAKYVVTSKLVHLNQMTDCYMKAPMTFSWWKVLFPFQTMCYGCSRFRVDLWNHVGSGGICRSQITCAEVYYTVYLV